MIEASRNFKIRSFYALIVSDYIYVLMAATVIGYLVLSTVQLRAIIAGLRARDFARFPALIIALLLAYLPVIGSAAGVYGAVVGWGWTVQKGVFRFFGSLLLIAATAGVP